MASQIIKVLNIVDSLLNIPRIGWIQRGVPRALAESVGEHTLLVSYITLILCNEIRRTGANVDASKCLSMALLHDAHEALIGNVGNSVRSMLTDWRDLEVRVFEDLGFNEELNNYFREYRYGLSIEGKLVSIADKLATYMRACKYAMAGYSTEELINNYKELVTRLTDDLPSDVREVIKELIAPISTWCVSKQSNNDKG
ncbi:hypothetical protein B7L70_06500 [Vulcanisaeta sp. EB80]|uniref:HD domain-containing protein n=1 Tax=Vulcanisaeta sp. EB80 TaxID=1650660 RepID=UPI0009BEEB2D|nr:HD family hydrolase [Vulcanisaeta sp. EB80]PLC67835.1 hypothetical protein B7L70_06500 [Vulcanisaeta sp. EB80]